MNGKSFIRKALIALSSFAMLISANIAYAVSANPTADCSAMSTCTVTFTYTGDYYSWTVPAGVTSITFDVQGGAGGVGKVGTSGTGGNGLGGRVQGTLAVTAGSSLFLYVGGVGGTGSGTNAGGFNGGGNGAVTGNYIGGGGGGSSDIRTTTSTASRLVVAAGGGGGGIDQGTTADHGGDGGGLTGAQGFHFSAAKAGGGSQSAGGAGEVYGGWTSGATGALFNGGNAGSGTGGGGGGGGYYGGGGGSWGGGGGGSSFANAVSATNVTHTSGYRSGNGQLLITYAKAIPASNTSLALGANATQATYREATIIIATVDQPGRVTFYSRGKRIGGCIKVLVSSTTATCTWRPTTRGAQNITASLTPSNGSTASSAEITISVVTRRSSR